jgi:glutamate racemase
MVKHSIGVFDSGYGGLTVFKSIAEQLPAYDYIYLGDNARAPYGDHSFETVYQYTLECVEWLFDQGCPLVILACNTASAKALRSIQQQVLPNKYPDHRVLGVIRPTAEVIQNYTQTDQVGVLGTRGTINSHSYQLEINKLFPDIKVHQQSCPMWVPLIENNEHEGDGADYFVQEYVNALLAKSGDIDCILLACTHYPMLLPKIRKVVPEHISLVVQGDIVAESLGRYLGNHPEIETKLSRDGKRLFFTSGDTVAFDEQGSQFFGQTIRSEKMTPDCKSA